MGVILDLLFPPKCVLCRRMLRSRELDLCEECRKIEEWDDRKRKVPFLDSFRAVWYYEENVRRGILRFKFHGARQLAPGFGRIMAMHIQKEYEGRFDVLTWVPVSPLRKLERGYDQVELLAKAAGKELGVEPLSTLRKRRHNRRQSEIHDPDSRKANVLGVYQVKDPDRIRGKRVLLLDDVLTTGATAGECARVLLTAGAAEVHCAALGATRKLKK